MKKSIFVILSVFSLCLLVGCSKNEQPIAFPSDEEIMENVAPYLKNALEQDVSTQSGLLANTGLSNEDILDASLYMGMPKQNTTYFAMATLANDADSADVIETFNNILYGWTMTAQQGYIQGNLDYEVCVKKDKVFAFMHENLEDFHSIQEYIHALPIE